MLVFRHQTAYSRFWNGRLHLHTCTTSIRLLTRTILVCVPAVDSPVLTPAQQVDHRTSITQTLNLLIAHLYTTKNHLRTEWGVALSPGTRITPLGQVTDEAEYHDLLPAGLKGLEHRGLGLTLELSFLLERFINAGVARGWFANHAASALLAALTNLTSAYGAMETIRLTPIPVAHLIHQTQVMSLYLVLLAFGLAADMGWWSVLLVAFVAFTLYGIEGIASTFEDPFRGVKGVVDLEGVVEDARKEIEVLLAEWGRGGEMFFTGGSGLARVLTEDEDEGAV